MEFSRQLVEVHSIELVANSEDCGLIELSDVQLLLIGGGSADVNLA